jgi:hypothetical protein
MSPLLGRRQPKALTAAATRITRGKAKGLTRLTQKWQERALGYYDTIGAIHFAGQFHSRAFTKLRLFPAELDENGDVQEIDNPKAREILDRLQDPNGGRSNMLGTYGRLEFLIGDSRLMMTIEDDQEKWEIVSPDELRLEQDGKSYRRVTAQGGESIELEALPDDAFEPVEGQVLVYRLWRRHPRYSEWADSSMRGILDDCEEYLRLSRTVRSRALSRIAGPGILWIPDEISFPSPEPGGDEDLKGFDQFGDDLTEALTAPMADEESAAAFSPMLVRAKGDFIEKVRLMLFRDAAELYPETGMRDECIKRIATGVDMPAEVLLGLADANHWSAWVVTDESFTAHIQPACQQLVDDLTSAYFRPACKQANLTNWERMVVGYDPAEVINHPNRGEDAQDAFDRGAINFDTYLEAKGFEATNRPTIEEVALMVAVKKGDLDYILTGVPAAPITVPPPDGGDQGGPRDGNEVEPGPPDEPPAKPPTPVTASAGVDRIVGAAELAVGRARELAGSRARRYANNGCEECRGLLTDVPQQQVVSVLGRERVRDLKAPGVEELVAGGASGLIETLLRWGIDQNRAGMIAGLVEQHAARTLFDERPSALPAGFAGYVKRITAEPLAA